VLKIHEDHAVLDAHADVLAASLGSAPDGPAPGGYGLATDFGFGSVSRRS
jgi:hypothetical protein